ncbi:DUF2637 domain-containing protein [Streptomyces luteireticuli]|uniref:DUF2637 domain-containing protein n=1 Tax=Streptomyces luteireticuli TaxID=173858 RepID=A0ABN0Y858_9ACTN
MKLATLTPGQLKSVEQTLSAGTWAITFGAVLFSVLTVTPLVRGVTAQGWGWTAPILPLVVDAAVVIVIMLDSTVARLGGQAGRWPTVLRWLTGTMTLALNIGDSALHHNLVGVAVHAVAPTLLIVTAEASLAYRRAIASALERIERERLAEAERERREAAAREQRERDERERERTARERAAREEREHAEHLERERADREMTRLREEREHAAKVEREREERQEQACQAEREEQARRRREEQEREERQRREQAARAERERLAEAEREQRERQERDRARAVREQAARTAREQQEKAARAVKPKPVNTASAPRKLTEPEAVTAVQKGIAAGLSVRQIADRTGWSVGWVNGRIHTERERQQEREREGAAT